MSKFRWAKFFWADWSNDTALNLCSIPARGLWMALLCLAAQGEPYGHVTIKGRIPTTAELFSLIAPRGTRRRDFNAWLAELEDRGVAERDHTGAIRSPRMSHEGVIFRARSEAGRSSWKGKHKRQNGRNLHQQNSVNPPTTDDLFASHRVQTPEAESPRGPPKGGRRGARQFGFGESYLADQEATDVEPIHAARASGARVVPITRRTFRG